MIIPVGTEFISQFNYPFGNPRLSREESSLDAHKGETLRVRDYNESLKMYIIHNVSLGAEEAWFMLSPANLKALMGKATEE